MLMDPRNAAAWTGLCTRNKSLPARCPPAAREPPPGARRERVARFFRCAAAAAVLDRALAHAPMGAGLDAAARLTSPRAHRRRAMFRAVWSPVVKRAFVKEFDIGQDGVVEACVEEERPCSLSRRGVPA